MANVNASIGININATNATGQLAALQGQLAALNKQMVAGAGASSAANARLLNDMGQYLNRSGQWSAATGNMMTAAGRLGQQLDKGTLSMQQWHETSRRATKQMGDHAVMNQLAAQRVRALQTQYVALGKEVDGTQRVMKMQPTGMLKDWGAEAMFAQQKAILFRRRLEAGANSMINWGKNTQWAGRQMMVGMGIPLGMAAVGAVRAFKDIETASISFKRVYGDATTSAAEKSKMLGEVQRGVAQEMTKYGIATSDTIDVAARAAATGQKGANLIAATRETMRLATLGNLDYNTALESTIATQTAFGVSAKGMTRVTDFLNAAENQTILSMEDMAKAIPRVAPVIKGLGGNVQDLGVLMTAMRAGGVSAEQGANALKSGLASLINPTDTAVQKLNDFGIPLEKIVKTNKGDLIGTVQAFGSALQKLPKFQQQQALESLFGKYQYARMGALFRNINKKQAQETAKLAKASSSELAKMSEQELNQISDSAMNKFQGAVERLKAAAAPLGEQILSSLAPVVDILANIVGFFADNSAARNVALFGAAFAGLAGTGVMLTGVFANFFGTMMKGFLFARRGFDKMTGRKLPAYQSLADLEASTAQKQLGAAAAGATGGLYAEAEAARILSSALDMLTMNAREAAAAVASVGGVGGIGGAGGVRPVSPTGPKGPPSNIPGMPPPGTTTPPRVWGTKEGQYQRAHAYSSRVLTEPSDIASFMQMIPEGETKKALQARVNAGEGIRVFENAVYGLEQSVNNDLDKAGVKVSDLADSVSRGGDALVAPLIAEAAAAEKLTPEEFVRKNPQLSGFSDLVQTALLSDLSTLDAHTILKDADFGPRVMGAIDHAIATGVDVPESVKQVKAAWDTRQYTSFEGTERPDSPGTYNRASLPKKILETLGFPGGSYKNMPGSVSGVGHAASIVDTTLSELRDSATQTSADIKDAAQTTREKNSTQEKVDLINQGKQLSKERADLESRKSSLQFPTNRPFDENYTGVIKSDIDQMEKMIKGGASLSDTFVDAANRTMSIQESMDEIYRTVGSQMGKAQLGAPGTDALTLLGDYRNAADEYNQQSAQEAKDYHDQTKKLQDEDDALTAREQANKEARGEQLKDLTDKEKDAITAQMRADQDQEAYDAKVQSERESAMQDKKDADIEAAKHDKSMAKLSSDKELAKRSRANLLAGLNDVGGKKVSGSNFDKLRGMFEKDAANMDTRSFNRLKTALGIGTFGTIDDQIEAIANSLEARDQRAQQAAQDEIDKENKSLQSQKDAANARAEAAQDRYDNAADYATSEKDQAEKSRQNADDLADQAEESRRIRDEADQATANAMGYASQEEERRRGAAEREAEKARKSSVRGRVGAGFARARGFISSRFNREDIDPNTRERKMATRANAAAGVSMMGEVGLLAARSMGAEIPPFVDALVMGTGALAMMPGAINPVTLGLAATAAVIGGGVLWWENLTSKAAEAGESIGNFAVANDKAITTLAEQYGRQPLFQKVLDREAAKRAGTDLGTYKKAQQVTTTDFGQEMGKQYLQTQKQFPGMPGVAQGQVVNNLISGILNKAIKPNEAGVLAKSLFGEIEGSAISTQLEQAIGKKGQVLKESPAAMALKTLRSNAKLAQTSLKQLDNTSLDLGKSFDAAGKGLTDFSFDTGQALDSNADLFERVKDGIGSMLTSPIMGGIGQLYKGIGAGADDAAKQNETMTKAASVAASIMSNNMNQAYINRIAAEERLRLAQVARKQELEKMNNLEKQDPTGFKQNKDWQEASNNVQHYNDMLSQGRDDLQQFDQEFQSMAASNVEAFNQIGQGADGLTKQNQMIESSWTNLKSAFSGDLIKLDQIDSTRVAMEGAFGLIQQDLINNLGMLPEEASKQTNAMAYAITGAFRQGLDLSAPQNMIKILGDSAKGIESLYTSVQAIGGKATTEMLSTYAGISDKGVQKKVGIQIASATTTADFERLANQLQVFDKLPDSVKKKVDLSTTGAKELREILDLINKDKGKLTGPDIRGILGGPRDTGRPGGRPKDTGAQPPPSTTTRPSTPTTRRGAGPQGTGSPSTNLDRRGVTTPPQPLSPAARLWGWKTTGLKPPTATPTAGKPQSVKVEARADKVILPKNAEPVKVQAKAEKVKIPKNADPVVVKAKAEKVKVPKNADPVIVKAKAEKVKIPKNADPVIVKAKSEKVKIPKDNNTVNVEARVQEVTGLENAANGQTVEVEGEMPEVEAPSKATNITTVEGNIPSVAAPATATGTTTVNAQANIIGLAQSGGWLPTISISKAEAEALGFDVGKDNGAGTNPTASSEERNGRAQDAINQADGGIIGLANGGDPMKKFKRPPSRVTGRGGPRDDKVPALLSPGEFVMNAKAVRKYGPRLMALLNGRRVNRGMVIRFKDGGEVSATSETVSAQGNNNPNNNPPKDTSNTTDSKNKEHAWDDLKKEIKKLAKVFESTNNLLGNKKFTHNNVPINLLDQALQTDDPKAMKELLNKKLSKLRARARRAAEQQETKDFFAEYNENLKALKAQRIRAKLMFNGGMKNRIFESRLSDAELLFYNKLNGKARTKWRDMKKNQFKAEERNTYYDEKLQSTITKKKNMARKRIANKLIKTGNSAYAEQAYTMSDAAITEYYRLDKKIKKTKNKGKKENLKKKQTSIFQTEEANARKQEIIDKKLETIQNVKSRKESLGKETKFSNFISSGRQATGNLAGLSQSSLASLSPEDFELLNALDDPTAINEFTEQLNKASEAARKAAVVERKTSLKKDVQFSNRFNSGLIAEGLNPDALAGLSTEDFELMLTMTADELKGFKEQLNASAEAAKRSEIQAMSQGERMQQMSGLIDNLSQSYRDEQNAIAEQVILNNPQNTNNLTRAQLEAQMQQSQAKVAGYQQLQTKKQREIEDINDQYDEQSKILDKIGQTQQIISNLQKGRLSIASALSTGDIAAAAAAAQEQRASEASANLDMMKQAQQDERDAKIKERQDFIDEQQKEIDKLNDSIADTTNMIETAMADAAVEATRLSREIDIQNINLKANTEYWKAIRADINESIGRMMDVAGSDFSGILTQTGELNQAWQNYANTLRQIPGLLDNAGGNVGNQGNPNDSGSGDGSGGGGGGGGGGGQAAGGAVGNTKWDKFVAKVGSLKQQSDKEFILNKAVGKGTPMGKWHEKFKALKESNKDLLISAMDGANVKPGEREKIRNTAGFYAKGGWIPGIGNKDSVHAMVMPGEFIVNKNAASKFGPLLEKINSPGFAISDNPAMANAGSMINSNNVYNVTVNANGTDDAEEIASITLQKIKELDSMKIREMRVR